MKINNLSDLKIWLEQENYTIVRQEAIEQIYDMITKKLNELNLVYDKNNNQLYLDLLKFIVINTHT
jgi:hypothetical protein